MKALDWVEYKHRNDRDIELPLVIQFVRKMIQEEVNSVLDIGAHYSAHTYAGDVSSMIRHARYDGVDILELDDNTAEYVNGIQGNFTELVLPNYDLILCISTIEHSGISTYKRKDYQEEQFQVFKKAINHCNKAFFLSHPYGLPGLYENEYANITRDLWERFNKYAKEKGFTVESRFFYNEFCQGGKDWFEVDQNFADQVPLNKRLGVQSLCVTEFRKTE